MGTRLTTRDGTFFVETPQHDGSLEPFLNSVWDAYKARRGVHLSNATHAPGEPWSIVAQHRDLNEKPTIPNELIEEVFRKKVERVKSETV